MTITQQNFRTTTLFTATPATVGLLIWSAQTPLSPFFGFVLIPSLLLAALAVFVWIDGKLAEPQSAALDLVCGDTRDISSELTAARRRPAA